MLYVVFYEFEHFFVYILSEDTSVLNAGSKADRGKHKEWNRKTIRRMQASNGRSIQPITPAQT